MTEPVAPRPIAPHPIATHSGAGGDRSAEAQALPTPPMVSFLPPGGGGADPLDDVLEIFRRGHRQFGPVFAVRLGAQPGVVLVGPRHHRFFFEEVDRTLAVPDVYRFVVPMFGEVLLAVRDHDTRRRQVGLMQSAFQGQRLAGHLEVMVAEVDAWLDTLGGEGTFELWEAMEGLSMNIASRALLGPEVRELIAEFRPLLDDLARGMDFVLPPELPLERFKRRDRARRLLSEMIAPVLEARRRCPGQRDFLQTLVEDPALAGGPGGDETLVGMALCTVFTGYITTAAQMAWALALLLEHPRYLGSVCEELRASRPPPGADGSGPARLARLEWALKEAQRLRPVMSHYARTNATSYVVDGYRIPKGWLTMLCPTLSHRLPEVFRDPERYDPERFGPPRQEDRRHPYALIGFSGGYYRCPGSAFGTAEMKTLLSRLLDRYEVALVGESPAVSFEVGVLRPASPCRVRYARRKRPLSARREEDSGSSSADVLGVGSP